jgi:hypothetical protein
MTSFSAAKRRRNVLRLAVVYIDSAYEDYILPAIVVDHSPLFLNVGN